MNWGEQTIKPQLLFFFFSSLLLELLKIRMEQENVEEEVNLQQKKKHKGKHDKPKPWDEDPNIDRWKIDKFDPSWNPDGLLEVSSFSTIFPRYRGN